MASNTIFLSGSCRWAKLGKPDEKYGNYQIDLYLDTPSLDVFKKAQMSITLKDKGEGPFVSLRRPVSKLIKGELVNFGPPGLIDKDNEDLDPVQVSLGNGSKVTCKVIVYDTMKGKGHRLEKVRVDELIEYKPNGEDADAPF